MPEQALNAGARGAKPQTGEDPGDPPGPPSRQFGLQEPDDLADEVREGVHRAAGTDDPGDPRVDLPEPVPEGLPGDEECR